MIISRTPLRISFVGGGSDISSYYRNDPGAVISTAINKYIYITINKKFDNKIRASYSVTEMVDGVSELKHELIRESLKLVGIEGGIEITSISDIPSQGTGLGSSSTYTVGLLNALYAYTGQFASAERLAREACIIEIECCGKPIGKQDQYIAAYGGLQYFQFNSDESVFADPIICSPETRKKLQERLLLLYTGVTRSANQILQEQKTNIENDLQKRLVIQNMVNLVMDLKDDLYQNKLDSFGKILHTNWIEKKKLASEVSNSQIDDWYERCRKHGAQGGKVLGAGGGGFLLIYAPIEKHREILGAVPELRPIPFKLEPQGSKIIYVEE
jgi:D-glycero-alpha-D-manno-heptose-7-phosphate kinase